MIRIENDSVHIGNNSIIQNAVIGRTIINETVITDNEIYINGVKMPPCPGKGHNSTIIDGRVFLNGYELIDGKWNRTLRALWHRWF